MLLTLLFSLLTLSAGLLHHYCDVMAHRFVEEGVFCGDWLQSHTATYRPGMHTTALAVVAGDLCARGLFPTICCTNVVFFFKGKGKTEQKLLSSKLGLIFKWLIPSCHYFKLYQHHQSPLIMKNTVINQHNQSGCKLADFPGWPYDLCETDGI